MDLLSCQVRILPSSLLGRRQSRAAQFWEGSRTLRPRHGSQDDLTPTDHSYPTRRRRQRLRRPLACKGEKEPFIRTVEQLGIDDVAFAGLLASISVGLHAQERRSSRRGQLIVMFRAHNQRFPKRDRNVGGTHFSNKKTLPFKGQNPRGRSKSTRSASDELPASMLLTKPLCC